MSRAKHKLKEIQDLFAAMREEVAGDRFWRYQRNVSPGLQEYIEALSFAHYLECQTLISYAEVQRSLSDAGGVPVCSPLLGAMCTSNSTVSSTFRYHSMTISWGCQI